MMRSAVMFLAVVVRIAAILAVLLLVVLLLVSDKQIDYQIYRSLSVPW
jgi:hypothetical protein